MSAPTSTRVSVNPDGTTTTSTVNAGSVTAVQFNADTCGNKVALAQSLTRAQQAAQTVATCALTNPFAQSILYKNLTAATSGTKTVIRHGLGRKAQWLVVGWRGAATTGAATLVDDSLDASPTTDANTLALRSYVAGTVDILVF